MKTLFAITASVLVLAAGAASAKEHRLPDGSYITVIRDSSVNMVRGNSQVVIISKCTAAKDSCATTTETSFGSGFLTGVPESLINGVGIVRAAKALRPAQTQVYNDSYSDSRAQGGDAYAFVDQSEHIDNSIRAHRFESYVNYDLSYHEAAPQ